MWLAIVGMGILLYWALNGKWVPDVSRRRFFFRSMGCPLFLACLAFFWQCTVQLFRRDYVAAGVAGMIGLSTLWVGGELARAGPRRARDCPHAAS